MEAKWATPERKAMLAQVGKATVTYCPQGHYLCPDKSHYTITRNTTIPNRVLVVGMNTGTRQIRASVESHTGRIPVTLEVTDQRLADVLVEDMIASWKADDRAEARMLEQEARGSTWAPRGYGKVSQPSYNGGLRKPRDPVSTDEYHRQRPEWQVQGYGVDPVTYKRLAHVVVVGTPVILQIPVHMAVEYHKPGKAAIRRWKRQGTPLPSLPTERQIIQAAVDAWWGR